MYNVNMEKKIETKIYQDNNYLPIIDDLRQGEVVGFPTETVYGLAIIYNDKKAFDKLYQIKNRSITKPISMMVSDTYQIEKVAYVDDKIKKVIDKFMPGPLTIILKAKENLPEHVTFNKPTIGIRIPNHKIALDILKKVNKPLLVTSANLSNEKALSKAKDVYNTFNGKIKSMIDVDASDDVASTVIDLSGNKPVLLRQGPITLEEIMKEYEG